MKLELQSVLDFGILKTLGVLSLGFSDYIVPIQLDLPKFHDLLRTSDIDVFLSKVVIRDGKALGITLIARRGWGSRLAAMSIIPEARSQKVGTWLMEQLVEEAIVRGDKFMELEVIEQNEPAVKLYQNIGFRKIRRLVGFKCQSPSGAQADILEIDIRQLANLVNLNGYRRLPWQLSGESLATIGPPNRAYRLDDSFAVISSPDADQMILRSVLTLPEARNRGTATQLLQALFEKFLDKNWTVPAIFPEEISGFFEQLGFELQDLSQFQMRLDFEDRSSSKAVL